MAPIIAFLIAIGVIFSASEATPELEAEYQQEFESYQENSIITSDLSEL
jgi:hypothetical protein